MGGEKRRFVNLIQMLTILVTFLITAVPLTSMAAGWADLVKDELYKNPRTLEGKAFLDHPITGATVRIYDRSGSLLHSVDSATGENGSFSITRPLPETFWIVIADGWMDGEPFDHDVRRYIRLFTERDYYKVNAVTTLMAEYQDRHPELSHIQVKKAVANFLSIPDSTDIDEIIYSSEWFCYYFSHYLFMKEAEGAEGMTLFVEQLGDELDARKTRSFYDIESVGSSLFKDVMEALLEGAASEFGGEGAGWILGLLNTGGGDDQRFDEMKADLQEILNDLKQIIGALKSLAHDLALDTNSVETYIEGINASDAISTIKTHYGPEGKDHRGSTNTLKYFSYMTSKDSNSTTKAQIATLVENINGAWDIEDQVQKIHDAIIPDIGDTNGLLDLWTDKFLLQGHVSDDQLMDYYKTLERYFSVLLFYQFKGASLVVEALNYQSNPGEQMKVSDLSSADGESPALSYLKGTFQPQIKEQTDRFIKCVTKLIANNCGLYWERRFLPGTAQEILARTTWFVIQTLGEDDYGLRVGLLGTKNLIQEVNGMMSGKKYDELIADPGELVDAEVPDRPYDYWGTLNKPDLNTLKKGASYSYLAFVKWRDYTHDDNGVPVPASYWVPGSYEVLYATPWGDYGWQYIGYALVKTYTKDYIEDPDGKISYGYILGELRRGGKEVIMDPSAFKRHYYHNNRNGDVNWWHDEQLYDDHLHLWVHGKNKYYNCSSDIDMKVEWYHIFTFDGSEPTKAYLNIAGNISGSVYIHHENTWSNEAKIGYHVGVGDKTHNKLVKRIDGEYEPSKADETQDYKKTLNDQISFTLEPGVTYYVYGNIWGYGENCSGDYEYKIKMNLTHLSLTFVDSEF